MVWEPNNFGLFLKWAKISPLQRKISSQNDFDGSSKVMFHVVYMLDETWNDTTVSMEVYETLIVVSGFQNRLVTTMVIMGS